MFRKQEAPLHFNLKVKLTETLLHFKLLRNNKIYFRVQAMKSYPRSSSVGSFNPLTPNDPYSGRTAPLTSKRCILYIYSTNVVTEYFKHGIHSPFFPLQNAVCFINLTYLVPVRVLFTFYIQNVLKLKK